MTAKEQARKDKVRSMNRFSNRLVRFACEAMGLPKPRRITWRKVDLLRAISASIEKTGRMEEEMPF